MRRVREITYGAIPTMYKGVQYRSRLEARTACFLDMHGLLYDYEPIDLNRYTPDFVVDLPHGPTLLECKPAITPQEFRNPCKRITKSGWVGPALVLGPRLSLVDDAVDLTMFGSTHAEIGRWTSMGLDAWPAIWGPYPFEDVFHRWRMAGNQVQWSPPDVS